MSLKKELIIISALVFAFILIRSIHFSEVLNFSMDQGLFSIKALELYRSGELSLIGPPISFHLYSREVSQGGVIYYFLLLFLILGNFDPIMASYIFMLFCGLMVAPLYFGTKWLMDRKAAMLISVVYVLLPYYINYTRFLWNVTFELSLIPILVFLMGFFNKKGGWEYFFLVSVCLGFILQFHYQFILVIVAVFIYYFFIHKIKVSYLPVYLAGLVLGFLPLVIFELRNNFYNFRTVVFYLQNWTEFSRENLQQGQGFQPHYFIAISFLLLFISAAYLRKILSYNLIVLVGVSLLGYSLFLFVPKPDHGFGMASGWSYLEEEKVYKIIRSNNTVNYNVTNSVYDSLASVQKYLLLKDGVKQNFNSYTENDYLYVITKDEDFSNNPAYEIQAMRPYGIEGSWVINGQYKLFLVKRLI